MTHARKTAAAAALAGVVALTVGALVGPAPGASAASFPDAPRIDWSSCGDGFQCEATRMSDRSEMSSTKAPPSM